MDGTWTDIPGIPSVWAAQMCAQFVRERPGSPGSPNTALRYRDPYTPSARSRHLYDGASAGRRP